MLTLIIIEHILKVVMDTCSKVTVLDHGEKIAEGTPSQIKDDNAVIEAYLGKKMDDEEMRKHLLFNTNVYDFINKIRFRN